MITVITGSPGSGKTLLAIQELLLPLLGTTVDLVDDDGVVTKVPRKVYTNINGLQLEHELIDGRADGGLRNWQEWAEPGAIIVFDEFQKSWPPRPNGSAVPADVQALDTHRHMAVDFILITQNLNNVDRHVVGLVGRHLHVRRLGNLPVCTIYEWDHASRSLLYSKAFSKRPFRYKRSTYKLYKSAKAHTKMPRRVPTLVWILVGAIGLAAYVMPNAYGRLSTRLSDGFAGKTALSDGDVPGRKVTVTKGPPPGMVLPLPEPEPAQDAQASVAPLTPARSAIAGCMAAAGRCECFTEQGQRVEQDKDVCTDLQQPKAGVQVDRLVVRSYFSPPPSPSALHF